MRLFPLLVARHQYRIGLWSLLAGLFPVILHRDELRDLPDYLLRDIGLSERRPRDWDRLLEYLRK